MNKYYYFSFLIILFALILPIVVSLGIRYIPGNTQPGLMTTERIYGSAVVLQSLEVHRDNFAGVGLSIKNPNFQNKKNITLTVLDDNLKFIRLATINGGAIGDGDYVKFTFEPIENSSNRKYYFVLSANEADISEALEVFYSNDFDLHRFFPEKLDFCTNEIIGQVECNSLSIKNTTKPSVSFVALYKPASFLSLVQEIYGALGAHMLEDKIFLLFWSFLVSGLFGYLVYNFFHTSKSVP